MPGDADLPAFSLWVADSGGGFEDVPASGELVATGDDAADGLAVGNVLLLEDAFGEGVSVVAVEYGDEFLEDDGSVVELLVDEVDGAAGDLNAVVEGLSLGVETREGREQRGVDVEDALREGLDKAWREKAHVACEANQVDAMLLEAVDDGGVVFGALASLGFDGDGGKAALTGGGKARCAG